MVPRVQTHPEVVTDTHFVALMSPLSERYYDNTQDVHQGYQNGAITGHAHRDDSLAHPQAGGYAIPGSQQPHFLTETASACDDQ